MTDLDAIRARNDYRRRELSDFGEDRSPGELTRQATIDDIAALLAEVERLTDLLRYAGEVRKIEEIAGIKPDHDPNPTQFRTPIGTAAQIEAAEKATRKRTLADRIRRFNGSGKAR